MLCCTSISFRSIEILMSSSSLIFPPLQTPPHPLFSFSSSVRYTSHRPCCFCTGILQRAHIFTQTHTIAMNKIWTCYEQLIKDIAHTPWRYLCECIEQIVHGTYSKHSEHSEKPSITFQRTSEINRNRFAREKSSINFWFGETTRDTNIHHRTRASARTVPCKGKNCFSFELDWLHR